MAEQIPGNFAATTVAASGYASGSGVLNVASTASPFPTTGAFSVVVYNQANDPPTPRGILRVATKASATQWTVAAEGADFNALAGDAVYAVISNEALTALLATSGGAAFSAITGSTNTTAAMVVGTGASIGATGSGVIAATTAATIAANTGTTNTVLHGNASGVPTFSAVSLSADVTGNLGVTHLNGGTNASSSTFWRGDGTWVAASGSSGYDTVEDEGTPLTQRSTINFVGSGVSAADTGGVTVVTIPGSSGPSSGSIFTPFNNVTTPGTSNWQNFSALTAIPGEGLISFPTSWKVRMRFNGGSPVIGGMKILRTLSRDTTVIGSTTVTIGSNASPTLTSPTLVETDAISLALDATHDYWFVIYFTNTGANAAVTVMSGGPASMTSGFVGGDQTAAGTIPSLTLGSQLVLAGIIP